MKRNILKKIFGLFLFLTFSTVSILNAQLATYPLRSGTLNPTNPGAGNPYSAATGFTSANVTATKMVVGTSITNFTAGSMNGTGLRVKTNNLPWPTAPTDPFNVDFGISPVANYDFILNGVTFKDTTHAGTIDLMVQLAYQVNGGPFRFIGSPVRITAASLNTTINFGSLNEGFYSGNNYVFRFYFYAASNNATITDRNNEIRINFVRFFGTTITPPSTNPVVNTGSIGVATKYSNTITNSNYSISNAGNNIKVVNRSGIVYSTNAIPTFANGVATNDIATNATTVANFNTNIIGLTPATTYYARAYAITQTDTLFGSIVNFTTQPYSIPTLNTTTATNVLSNRATTGGNNIDSGGYSILEKGVCYSLTNNPTYAGTKTSDGINRNDFSTVIKSLNPSTKYYIRAFARNQLGIGYGNLDSFTTTIAVPALTATPNFLNFGKLSFNSTANVLSYRLNANFLNPQSGTITINANNGYTLSTTYNGTFSNSITINYNSGNIQNRIIYVKTKTDSYGIVNGSITHTGGGVVNPNYDTVLLSTTIAQSQDTLSNMGSDFYCGFGYQEKMSSDAGATAEAKLSIYVTTGNQPATVHVDLTSGGYSQTQVIPANSSFEFKNFPTGSPSDNYNSLNLPDSRLYATGVSNKSIHIYTDNGVPVSAFLHSYVDGNSAAGAMLFPTNTWQSNYIVQGFGGRSNNANPNSFFFVIALQDSTPITFTPKNDVLDSILSPNATLFTDDHNATQVKYKKDSTYTIYLNKGQVFNAMGFIQGAGSSANGLDLSGTIVKTTCDKKITVFAGNGRCFVNGTAGCNQNAGSDHLIQQMFPSVAWGTKYLTMPLKNLDINYFRIYVQNPAIYGPTRVWVNNPNKTATYAGTLVNNLYYEFQTNQPSLIESDKPINVTQFMLTPRCVNNVVDGGPEMIMLSPIQQSINSVTLYSAGAKRSVAVQTNPNGTATGSASNWAASYINVIIPKSDTGNFTFNGNKLVDTGRTLSLLANGTLIRASRAFKVHPQDTNYCYANFWVNAPQAHTLKSNRGFNVIAYGMGAGESYGYNGGTAINNLSSISVTVNPSGTDTSSGSVKTVKNNLVYLQIAVPYDSSSISSIVWNAGNDASRYSPIGDVNGIINPSTNKPICLGTIVKDGRTFFIYQSPVQYEFFEDGAYQVNVTFNGTFVSDCGGTDVKNVNVVVGRDELFVQGIRTPANDCLSKTITLQDNSVGFAGTRITTCIWDYGDGSKKDTVLSTQTNFPYPTPNSHTYPANAVYYLKLTTINSIGGITTDSFLVDLSFSLQTSFAASKDTVCVNEVVTFTPSSAATAVKWFWDYGDGGPIDSFTNSNPRQKQYLTEGNKIIRHWVKNSLDCPSEIMIDTIHVSHTPIPNFILPSGVCIPGNTLFTNTSDTSYTPSSMPYTYKWNFGTGNVADTSNAKDPIFKYTTTPPPGGYPVSLTVTSKFGCASNTLIQNVTNVFAPPVPKYKVVSRISLTNEICNTEEIQLIDSTTMPAGNISRVVIYWDTSSTRYPGLNLHLNPTIDNSPQNGVSPITPKIYKFKYPHNRLSQNVMLRVLTYSNNNCVSDTFIAVRIAGTPIVKFDSIKGVCINSNPIKINFGYDSTNFFDIPPYPRLVGKPIYSGNGVYNDSMFNPSTAGVGTHYVKVMFQTRLPLNNGCKDSAIAPIQVWGLPTVNFDTALVKCEKSAIQFSDISTASTGSGSINKWSWNFGDPSSGIRNTDTVKNPTHEFNNWGKYSISLTVTSDSGCVNTINPLKVITVNPLPKVDFVLPKGTCVNSPVAFRDLSKIADSTMSGFTHTWNFGNTGNAGNIVTGNPLPNPTYVYSTPPTDSIKLIVRSQFGCIDSTSKKMPTGSIFAKPISNFRANGLLVDTIKVCSGTSVTFSDASDSVAATSYWIWGDNGNTVESGNPINKIFTATNTQVFNGYHFIDDVNGCRSDSSDVISLVYALPTVNFDTALIKCERDSTRFRDISVAASGTGTINSWLWNFGDPLSGVNNTSNLQNPSHFFNNDTTYQVSLTVTTTTGCSNTINPLKTITINPKPIVNFSMPTGVCQGLPVVFTDLSKIADSTMSSFNHNWIFGDPTSTTNTAQGTPLPNPSHLYSGGTTDSVRLIVTSNKGCIDSMVKAVGTTVIIPATPTYRINGILRDSTQTTSVCLGSSIRFEAGFTARSYNWTFGDTAGIFYNQFRLQHTYPTANTFKGFLSMIDNNGCQTKAVPFNIEIWSLPVVNFEFDNIRCEKTDVNFRDLSTTNNGTINSRLWNFGEPTSGLRNTSTLALPSHNYANFGSYNVTLTVQNSNGCSNTSLPIPITINPKPLANFSFQDTVCLPSAANFKDASTISDGSELRFGYTWNFGDIGSVGNVLSGSGLTNVNHIYPISANYNVTLTITSKDRCVDDTVRTITTNNLRNQPIARYIVSTPSVDTPQICFGDSIIFRDNSLNVKESYWIWGNGRNDTSISPAPQYGLTLPGIYFGTHYIIDNYGCRSLNKNFTTIINQVPEVIGKTVYVRPNNSIVLTPSYKNASAYSWELVKPNNSLTDYLNFDDINFPTCNTNKNLSYLVTAYNDGCASIPDSFHVKMLDIPKIPSAFSPNGDGINDTWDLGSLINYVGASVQVFDRFGHAVFTRPIFSQNWNGKIQNNGADCPTGVYYYIINPGSGVPTMSGYVTILR